jgi:hypothetical protein
MSDPNGPDSPQALLRQATAWLQDHLLNHAEITLRRVLAAEPANSRARRLHGIALFGLGRREEGIAAIRAGAEAEPGNPRAWADLAVALRDAGQPQAADAAYATALTAQTPGLAAPPLATQVFSPELARHEFRIVDYPYSAEIRWGAGRPAHPELAALIDAGRPRYAAFLDQLAALQGDFAEVPMGGTYDTAAPFWLNAWFSALDAVALTGMLKAHNPARLVEIGSGMSTKCARRAIARYGLRTAITSIDPEPRNQVDRLCDQVIRAPLERCDLALFEALAPGDVAFLDSSHRSFQGSDVTVFFLEILPRLKPGVIVHIHDVYLPEDYISGHVPRLWNEQYLLATALLFGPQRFEILFPSWFVGRDPELSAHANAALRRGPMAELDLYGASFWMRMT